VRQLLLEMPEMPATVLAERAGWTGSIRWFRDEVNWVRADHPRSIRPTGCPGHLLRAGVPDALIPVDERLTRLYGLAALAV